MRQLFPVITLCYVAVDAVVGPETLTLERSVTAVYRERTVVIVLWTIIVILLALWVLGIIGSVGGAAIHLLLLIAAFVLVAQLVSGRSTAQ